MKRHDLAWQLPLRLTAGTYILDSGLHKRHPDEETAKHLHGFASGAYPWERLVTHAVPLDGVASLLADPPQDYLKAVVHP